jgi:cysteine synthase
MLTAASRPLVAGGCAARIIALEPASSPAITAGRAGPHRVEGIGLGYVPPHLDRDAYDEARAIDEREAREIARHLARTEFLAGTSTRLAAGTAVRSHRDFALMEISRR